MTHRPYLYAWSVVAMLLVALGGSGGAGAQGKGPGFADAVITGLVLYTLTILVRNLLAGLDGVDAEVLDAARGMGLSRARTLWRVEVPLALPAAMAGLRVATVSTVALTTVGTIVGFGGLGDLLTRGLRSSFHAEVFTASALCVLLAVVLDLLLLGAQRVVTPWQRGRA